ncbi:MULTISPECIES: hypothetical protein [Vibrio]|uniref:hypothetical protein n=1 Tax=Vibrio TaxID=662 RepID=UPI00037BFB2A|nr:MULTISPECIES: hypothetical protein [Vibrio]
MKRQHGVSVFSFLLALVTASATLAVTLPMIQSAISKAHNEEAFKIVASEVLSALELAISDHWQSSECRALSVPPTLKQLVDDYQANPIILTAGYDVKITYHFAPKTTFSNAIKLTITPPSHVPVASLKQAAMELTRLYVFNDKTLELYKALSPISSQMQLQYFDGKTGCMQKDYR